MSLNLVEAALSEIRNKIRRRCQTSGVDPDGINILGVTKFVPAEMAVMAVRAGLTDLGENRVQEASGKIPEVRPRPRWHLIGHLQRNKVKKAVELFDVIESVDSVELAGIISAHAVKIGSTQDIYIQLNSSGESSKHGFGQGEISASADKIIDMPALRLCGLMTMGPLTDNIELIKRSFELTSRVFEKMKTTVGDNFTVLSMGMSGDYELALDFGANQLRLGTAIFGHRPAAN